ncbi:hypothetical protein [Nocardioides limicola]|uniref:hypothetical protein n=1 Tax=Nocardioides limicola TaxID=2803368 RepID=UPI00193B375A|nr:hypothetical protein [Nocardioides sp. DJM-14]
MPRVRGYAYANYGRWNHSEYPDIEFSYQWLVDGEPEAGATDQMFEPRLRHLDAMLQVAVTAHHPDADPVQVVSAAKRVYPGVFHQSMPPTIYGFVIVGGSAKVQPRRWTPRPQSIEYRWFIKRPDASRYRPLPRLRNKKEFPLRRRHAGSRIKVRVIVSRPGFHKARAWTPRRTVGWSRTNGVKTINGVPCHTC